MVIKPIISIFIFFFFCSELSGLSLRLQEKDGESVTQYRNDYVSEISSYDPSDQGGMSSNYFCDPGVFATGLGVNIFPFDMSFFGQYYYLNTGAQLQCGNGIEYVRPPNYWTAFNNWQNYQCPFGSFIRGFKTSSDGLSNGVGSFQAMCSDSQNTIIQSPVSTTNVNWGSNTWSFCPTNSVVCGIRQRYDNDADDLSGDIGVVTQIKLECCKSPVSLSDPKARWERVAGLGGGSQIKATVKFGVEKHEESTLTDEFSNEVSSTVEAGTEFLGIGGTVSLTYAASQMVSSSLTSSVTTTVETTREYSCEEGDQALYQWTVGFTEGGSVGNFDIYTFDFWCVSDDSYVPRCPFGYCADEDCQTCDPFTQSILVNSDWTIGYTTNTGIPLFLMIFFVSTLLLIVGRIWYQRSKESELLEFEE